MKLFRVKVLTLFLILGLLSTLFAQDSKKGVYEFVVQNVQQSFEEASDLLEQAIKDSDSQFVTAIDQAAKEKCDFRSKVFVLYDSKNVEKLFEINSETAPFAVTDRINLFEDENGVHVSIVNPTNIYRTVFLDDQTYSDLFELHRQKLRDLVLNVVQGTASEKQYGPIRKKGHIGKTMGVMAGGPFNEKIKDIVNISDSDFNEIVNKVESVLNTNGKWQLKKHYTIKLESQDVAILGVSSPSVESKSFDIVKAGSDKSRKKFACPGIAHAGAYPIDIVVFKKNGEFTVQLIEVMYRMKMYFEDAGKWAFMKNMTMPGSIQEEIEKALEAVYPGN
jgi:hypothetical protein